MPSIGVPTSAYSQMGVIGKAHKQMGVIHSNGKKNEMPMTLKKPTKQQVSNDAVERVRAKFERGV